MMRDGCLISSCLFTIPLACVLKVGERLVCLSDHEGMAIDEYQGLLTHVLPENLALACVMH